MSSIIEYTTRTIHGGNRSSRIIVLDDLRPFPEIAHGLRLCLLHRILTLLGFGEDDALQRNFLTSCARFRSHRRLGVRRRFTHTRAVVRGVRGIDLYLALGDAYNRMRRTRRLKRGPNLRSVISVVRWRRRQRRAQSFRGVRGDRLKWRSVGRARGGQSGIRLQ